MISHSYPNPVLNQTKSRTKYQSLGLTLLNARSSLKIFFDAGGLCGLSPLSMVDVDSKTLIVKFKNNLILKRDDVFYASSVLRSKLGMLSIHSITQVL